VRGRGRPPRRAAVDPRRELQPGGRVPRACPPRVRPPNERPGGARAGDRGSAEARAVPPGKWPLDPAGHPRSPDAGGARIPPRELRRIERRPAPRHGPLGPGHARAEREELGGALKPGPWFSRRNGRALLCAAPESEASPGANSLRGPGSRVHVPARGGHRVRPHRLQPAHSRRSRRRGSDRQRSAGAFARRREPVARRTHPPGSRLPPTSDGGYVRSGRHRETRERIQGPPHHEEASLMSKPPTCREVTPADSTKLVPLFEGFYG